MRMVEFGEMLLDERRRCCVLALMIDGKYKTLLTTRSTQVSDLEFAAELEHLRE